MRRKEKEIRSKAEMEEIIRRARVCRLGLCDGSIPYVVPVCFGYDRGRIFVHSAPEGRKLDIIAKNPHVCFELESDLEIRDADEACGWSIAYRCVMGSGRAVLVRDPAEKKEALEILMKQYSPRDYSFTESDLKGLAVIRIDIQEMTGKASR